MRWIAAVFLMTACSASAQWQMQESHTTADLRGIANVGNGVAWASGTHGTVLKTVDGGKNWQICALPPDAEKLDFRGVQAFDAKTAIVMSSGPGDASRLYKTVDGCATWKLVFTNPDKDGFWDAATARIDRSPRPAECGPFSISGSIFGDPSVHKSNPADTTTNSSFYLATFVIGACDGDRLNFVGSTLFSGPGEAAFAASNSVLIQPGPSIFWMATSRELLQYEISSTYPTHFETMSVCGIDFEIPNSKSSAGTFSFAVRPSSIEERRLSKMREFRCRKSFAVAVGGDYLLPDESAATASFTGGDRKFHLAQSFPHGYRSAVAYESATRSWLTVGPNGTDVSFDDGRNWRALKPSGGDAADADKNWNALSLPFVVGPKGRIGILQDSAVISAQNGKR